MTIITKHEIGTTIHFMHNNKVLNSVIRGFKIEVSDKETMPDVTYMCNKEDDKQIFLKVPEKDAYPSKEALLKSL